MSKKIILITGGACKPINDPTELEFWGYVPEGTFLFVQPENQDGTFIRGFRY